MGRRTNLVNETSRIRRVRQQCHRPTQLGHRTRRPLLHRNRSVLVSAIHFGYSSGGEVFPSVGHRAEEVSGAAELDVGLEVEGELER